MWKNVWNIIIICSSCKIKPILINFSKNTQINTKSSKFVIEWIFDFFTLRDLFLNIFSRTFCVQLFTLTFFNFNSMIWTQTTNVSKNGRGFDSIHKFQWWNYKYAAYFENVPIYTKMYQDKQKFDGKIRKRVEKRRT